MAPQADEPSGEVPLSIPPPPHVISNVNVDSLADNALARDVRPGLYLDGHLQFHGHGIHVGLGIGMNAKYESFV